MGRPGRKATGEVADLKDQLRVRTVCGKLCTPGAKEPICVLCEACQHVFCRPGRAKASCTCGYTPNGEHPCIGADDELPRPRFICTDAQVLAALSYAPPAGSLRSLGERIRDASTKEHAIALAAMHWAHTSAPADAMTAAVALHEDEAMSFHTNERWSGFCSRCKGIFGPLAVVGVDDGADIPVMCATCYALLTAGAVSDAMPPAFADPESVRFVRGVGEEG